ncbi:hypothetical protein ACFSTA_17355 [Ornithinibacillus salinisoli]|uniref:Nuclear transport factor 2 family protein n=1 Tax=Ornithinibacillus salinisoli TaxID=1848459 RepID=A0ABW4W1E2_9BACI
MESNNQLEKFTIMHDQFTRNWNEAMNSGETCTLERMTENYYVAFFRGVHDQPTMFQREEAVSGMKQSVHQLLGAKKKFENRVIRLRDDGNAVVFYEQVIEKEGKTLARLFTIENWLYTNGRWMIAREIEEAVS